MNFNLLIINMEIEFLVMHSIDQKIKRDKYFSIHALVILNIYRVSRNYRKDDFK